MEINTIEDVVQCAKNILQHDGSKITRMNDYILESIGPRITFTIHDSKELHRDLEIKEIGDFLTYHKMLMSQLETLKDEYDRDNWNRRMLIQFDRDYYYNRNMDFVPCMESIQILLDVDRKINLIINLRSSNISKLENDMNMIFAMVQIVSAELDFELEYNKVILNISSLHEYLDA